MRSVSQTSMAARTGAVLLAVVSVLSAWAGRTRARAEGTEDGGGTGAPQEAEATRRAWLGLELREVPAALAAHLGSKAERGALVVRVVEGGPAARGGVRLHDVILAIDGEPLGSAAGVAERVAKRQPSERLKLRLLREGRPREIGVELGERPEEESRLEVKELGDRKRLVVRVAPRGRKEVRIRRVRSDGDGSWLEVEARASGEGGRRFTVRRGRSTGDEGAAETQVEVAEYESEEALREKDEEAWRLWKGSPRVRLSGSREGDRDRIDAIVGRVRSRLKEALEEGSEVGGKALRELEDLLNEDALRELEDLLDEAQRTVREEAEELGARELKELGKRRLRATRQRLEEVEESVRRRAKELLEKGKALDVEALVEEAREAYRSRLEEARKKTGTPDARAAVERRFQVDPGGRVTVEVRKDGSSVELEFESLEAMRERHPELWEHYQSLLED